MAKKNCNYKYKLPINHCWFKATEGDSKSAIFMASPSFGLKHRELRSSNSK